ncbi:MAG TPA: Ig-like domain repeat protein, partial [Chitinophagaceae bacterium]|nr:Ig-like domain repeat protein [Chitinophagaceae bacterium]
CSNTASCTATVTVKKRPTTITYTSDLQEQYSDEHLLTATLVDQLTGAALAGRVLTFTIGNQLVKDTTDANGHASTSLTITQDPLPTYKVQVSFAGEDVYQNSACEHAFDILQEDGRVTYTGSMFSSTEGITSGRATVTLSATIQDISVTEWPNGDILSGDICNARVKFINRDNGTDISGWLTPGLVTPGDLTTGTVTYKWPVDIGIANSNCFTVGIIVDGYYICDYSADNTVITVSKPVPDFITGGGYLVLETPAGLKAGDRGSKTNFGFNVKYNKSVRNLQGQINSIVRRTEGDGVIHVYQIKGNAMTSLVIDANLTTDHPYPTAVFDGKASIQDITDPSLPISIDGNASLHVEIVDRGEPGNTDSIAITVWNKDGGLWFASRWNGSRTTKQQLAAGNLVVSGRGGAPVTTSPTTITLTSPKNPSTPGTLVTFTATIVPVTSSTIAPTGKVTFYDGTTALRTVSVTTQGGKTMASFSTEKLKVGEHAMAAVYSGDQNFSASTSPTLIQIVAQNSANLKLQPVSELQVSAYPNPAPSSFNVVISSNSNQPVNLRVIDIWGRTIEIRSNVPANGTVVIGRKYRPGNYFAEVIQGKKRVMVRLMKQSD